MNRRKDRHYQGNYGPLSCLGTCQPGRGIRMNPMAGRDGEDPELSSAEASSVVSCHSGETEGGPSAQNLGTRLGVLVQFWPRDPVFIDSVYLGHNYSLLMLGIVYLALRWSQLVMSHRPGLWLAIFRSNSLEVCDLQTEFSNT